MKKWMAEEDSDADRSECSRVSVKMTVDLHHECWKKRHENQCN